MKTSIVDIASWLFVIWVVVRFIAEFQNFKKQHWTDLAGSISVIIAPIIVCYFWYDILKQLPGYSGKYLIEDVFVFVISTYFTALPIYAGLFVVIGVPKSVYHLYHLFVPDKDEEKKELEKKQIEQIYHLLERVLEDEELYPEITDSRYKNEETKCYEPYNWAEEDRDKFGLARDFKCIREFKNHSINKDMLRNYLKLKYKNDLFKTWWYDGYMGENLLDLIDRLELKLAGVYPHYDKGGNSI